MRGPKPKYPIELTEAEQEHLEHVVRAQKTGQALLGRARIVLTANAHPAWSNQQIAREVGTSDRQVRKWRARWIAVHRLADAPRAGAPRRFSPETRAQVTVAACSLPCQSEIPLARWSRAELARQLASRHTGPMPSASTIGRWLQAERIRPWRYHFWQHIQDPEQFLQQARPVLRLYERARDLLAHGIWLVCSDEKTSLQAREAEQAPRPAIAKSPLRQSPRYRRRGARHRRAGLSVADGQVDGQCTARKRFVDFRAFLEQVLLPEARRRQVKKLILILDNGTTHAPKPLACWIQQQQETEGGQLSIEVVWLPRRASWLDQIEIWLSLLQRKLLQPNHFASTEALEHAIQSFLTYYNQTAKPINWSYTVEKLEQKLGAHLR